MPRRGDLFLRASSRDDDTVGTSNSSYTLLKGRYDQFNQGNGYLRVARDGRWRRARAALYGVFK